MARSIKFFRFSGVLKRRSITALPLRLPPAGRSGCAPSHRFNCVGYASFTVVFTPATVLSSPLLQSKHSEALWAHCTIPKHWVSLQCDMVNVEAAEDSTTDVEHTVSGGSKLGCCLMRNRVGNTLWVPSASAPWRRGRPRMVVDVARHCAIDHTELDKLLSVRLLLFTVTLHVIADRSLLTHS